MNLSTVGFILSTLIVILLSKVWKNWRSDLKKCIPDRYEIKNYGRQRSDSKSDQSKKGSRAEVERILDTFQLACYPSSSFLEEELFDCHKHLSSPTWTWSTMSCICFKVLAFWLSPSSSSTSPTTSTTSVVLPPPPFLLRVWTIMFLRKGKLTSWVEASVTWYKAQSRLQESSRSGKAKPGEKEKKKERKAKPQGQKQRGQLNFWVCSPKRGCD